MSQQKFTLYLIHHSHTDIGYTDYQEKVELHHIYYIKEVIDILNAIHAGETKWEGFKWNCESFWCVEKFLETADQSYIDDFIKYVKSGEIGLSGNYLNMTELVDYTVLNNTIARSVKSMERYSIQMASAMTADINGYGWGYADALYENGIRNLMSCIHTHHGYHPLFKKQMPFYWQSPKGNKLLVWNGEHYLIGNELVCNEYDYEYSIHDGLMHEHLSSFDMAEKRIESYVRVLKEQQHPYDFVPVSISGVMRDNSPASAKIIEFIHEYNAIHGQEIELQMVTLDEFFDILNQAKVEIPTYSGDWTDWWADGVGSTPNIVQHYREASRKLYAARQLDPDGKIIGKEVFDSTEYNLMFYAEHTWGYSSSIVEPWHPNVNKLDLRKSLFALKANESASRAINKITYFHGETSISVHKQLTFGAINPHDFPVIDVLNVSLESLFGHRHFEILEKDTGLVVPHQIGHYARGYEVNILVKLDAKQKKSYVIRDIAAPPLISAGNCAKVAVEGVNDLASTFAETLQTGSVVTPYKLDNKFFRIQYEEGQGITSIYDNINDKELIKPTSKFNAFTPIYEVTPVKTTQYEERRLMGRNRKAVHTQRDIGKLLSATVLEDGPLYSRVELGYQLQGTNASSLILTAYKEIPRIDVDFRFHKTSVWEPENLYLALPFTTGYDNEEFWVEKTGTIFRPRIDQLPGTCTDFYALQDGMCYQSSNSSLIIATPDTPLIAMGDIKSHEIKLCGEEGVNNIDDVYAWVMNNFWETNFKVDLGGFHQYRYSLLLNDSNNVDEAFKTAKATNCPVLGYYSFI